MGWVRPPYRAVPNSSKPSAWSDELCPNTVGRRNCTVCFRCTRCLLLWLGLEFDRARSVRHFGRVVLLGMLMGPRLMCLQSVVLDLLATGSTGEVSRDEGFWGGCEQVGHPWSWCLWKAVKTRFGLWACVIWARSGSAWSASYTCVGRAELWPRKSVFNPREMLRLKWSLYKYKDDI